MRRITILLIVCLAVAPLSGCTLGSRRMVRREVPVAGFDRVVFESIGELNITQGSEESLAIRAESNVQRRIDAEVRGSTLTIGFRRGLLGLGVVPTRGIQYDLTVRELEGLELAGVGAIHIAALETERLDIGVHGAGQVVVRSLAAERLEVDHTGVGSCEVSGRAARQRVELTGAGSYDAADLRSEDADVHVSGVGKATVWAQETLDVEISGAGSVSYYGAPELEQRISGVGDVRSMGRRN